MIKQGPTMSQTEQSKSPKKGIYLLPNLFTTAGLFAGFYSIVSSMQGRFELACMTIFIAMLADGLDGRVARLTNTQSAFGAEYDSLSDMIAFGLAPALLAYTWSLHTLGKIGWLVAFFYVASTGLRLARFNVQGAEEDKRFFSGLACPAAAAVMGGFVWVMLEYGVTDGTTLPYIVSALVVLCAALMLSSVKYYSFKVFDFKNHVPFTVLIVVVLAVMAIAMDPAQVLFYAFAAYMVLGPFLARLASKEEAAEEATLTDTDEELTNQSPDAATENKTMPFSFDLSHPVDESLAETPPQIRSFVLEKTDKEE
jgi:CDP-diacylglycerol--serine O-phosphatidyltransferase